MYSFLKLGGMSLLGVFLLGRTPDALGVQNLATVNRVPIQEKHLKLMLKTLNEGQKSELLSDPGQKRRVLRQAIDRELLYQEAKVQKIQAEAEFKARLRDVQRELLVSYFLEKKVTSKITTARLKKFFSARRSIYNTDMARVRHIVLNTESQAKKILALAKKPKADFSKLAVTYSVDPEAKNNEGDLGVVRRGQHVPEFTNAVFRASKGAVVGPVRTLYGYHVIQIIDKKLGKPLSYDEAEARVEMDYRKFLIAQTVDRLAKKAKIVISPKL